MRITFANTHDLVGGAERCSYDLASTLSRAGDHVELIVGRKFGDDRFVRQLKYRPTDWRLRSFLYGRFGLTETVIAAPIYGCWTVPGLRQAEVYNIHNMHGGYWNFWTLPILSRRAPVILTLHDEWLLTGDCAYAYDCERWTHGCGECPQAGESRAVDRVCIGGGDLTRLNLRLKGAMTRRLPEQHVELVTPSRWLAERAARSPHLSRFDCRVIYNGIDLEEFSPRPRDAARRHFDLPRERFLVLCLAANQFDRRKNLRVLLDAVRSSAWPAGATLVIAGRVDEALERELKDDTRIRLVGFVDGRNEVATLLSSCDLIVIPSLADNLPYTALEAQACGLPVLAADVGGMAETIEKGCTGWLFDPMISADALAARISEVNAIPTDDYERMRRAARDHCERRFGLEDFVASYRRLFEDHLERWRRS